MIELLCLPFGFAILYAFAATPLLRAAAQPPTLTRVRSSPIDGLRGVLALSVVFYHGYLTERLISGGVWRIPTSRFFAHLGPSAVAVFFMITGYLFWATMNTVDNKRIFCARPQNCPANVQQAFMAF